jgi:hypothetical protein
MKIGENLIYTYPEINAYDVIHLESLLIMIGDDGIYQYDSSDISNIRILSSIKVDRN